MNFIDILLLIPMAFACWKGFKKGFVIELFMLLAILAGIYAGIHFSDWTSERIAKSIEINSDYLPVIAFTITLLGVGALLFFAGKLIEGMINAVQLSLVNKLLGLFFSLAKTLYILSVLIVLLESYDEKGNFIPNETKEESILYYPVKTVSTSTIPALKESTIWLKNNADSLMNKSPDVSIEDLKRMKEKADSLGIEPSDLEKTFPQ